MEDNVFGKRRYGPIEYDVYLIRVDGEVCDGCGECMDICPTDVFELVGEDVIPTRPESCLYCLGCLGVCATGAVTITEI